MIPPDASAAFVANMEDERLVLQFEEFVHDLHGLEADLQRLEQERGLLVDSTKPLSERMAAVGIGKQAIDRISSLLDAFDKITLGRMGRRRRRAGYVSRDRDAPRARC